MIIIIFNQKNNDYHSSAIRLTGSRIMNLLCRPKFNLEPIIDSDVVCLVTAYMHIIHEII